ncbi:MAG: hypothetical protein ACRD0E_04055, partial [Acidimicrobiales bacterium]
MKKPVFVRWAPWWALGAVVVVVLAIGSHRPGPPPTLDQRVDQIASGIRCPSCADLSAAQSDASTA